MIDIEYFFSTHSAFAYFGARRFYEIAAAAKGRVVHKPVDFWPVVRAARGPDWGGFSDAQRDYFFGVEVDRWSAYRNAPIALRRPTFHDAPLDLSSGLLIAAEKRGDDIGPLSFAILEAHWKDDADISDRATLAAIAQRVGLDDPQATLTEAETDEIQAIFRANTDEAIERSVFGSPTYVVDGEVFYGQDRLELLEARLAEA